MRGKCAKMWRRRLTTVSSLFSLLRLSLLSVLRWRHLWLGIVLDLDLDPERASFYPAWSLSTLVTD